MKTNLNFEREETKKLLCKLDFEFFLKQNFKEENYKQENIDKIYESFKQTDKQINKQINTNEKQFNLYCESQVRRMFTGGLLPSLFGLDDSRGNTIIDFSEIGKNWAYFHTWQEYYRKKITVEKIWDIVIKTGSILAILLTILKLIETFT